MRIYKNNSSRIINVSCVAIYTIGRGHTLKKNQINYLLVVIFNTIIANYKYTFEIVFAKISFRNNFPKLKKIYTFQCNFWFLESLLIYYM